MRELEDKVRTLSAQLVEPEKIQSLNKMLNPLTDVRYIIDALLDLTLQLHHLTMFFCLL